MTSVPHRSPIKRLARWVLGHAMPARLLLEAISLLLRVPGPPRALGRKLEIAITKRLKLFDRLFYLGQFEPGQAPSGPPLRHYIRSGDSQGRHPAPLFDPAHYRQQCDAARGPANALLHYGLYGRFRRISPSPWLDIGYYLSNNSDVAASKIDPLQHFVRFGWREGRNPLPGLDMRVLLCNKPGLRVSRSNPLVQMLNELGANVELREPHTRPEGEPDDEALLLQPDAWHGLALRRGDGAPRLDVIVPVYSGRSETLRCLRSVLAAQVATPFELVVIDDASPDAELSATLARLAGAGLFTLHRNAANQGFVATVNLGLNLHADRDVVILNADTEVHNDWLDRLVAIGATDPAIASVTPLSNNATICSYPEPLHDNWMPLEVDDAELDRLAAQANGLKWVAAPTGVGFCMWMRRACIAEIGVFDHQNFGRGYGEENDWCQRAIERDWVNAVTGGVFVRHHGSVSFRAEAGERIARAMRTLQGLHPTYEHQVQRFIANDPLWVQRARLSLARLARQRQENNTLLVSHDRGGGTERHLVEQAEALEAAGEGTFELRPSKRPGAVALAHPRLYGLNAIGRIPVADSAFFMEAMQTLGIRSIQLHHLIDFTPGLPALLLQARRQLGLELVTTLHDYHAICPRINLARTNGRYCGEPDEAGCNSCLATDGLIAKSGDIVSWRAQQLDLLRQADRIVVPDEDVQRRLARYWPVLPIEVCPHDEPLSHVAPAPAARGDGRTRVLVIGAISRIKGYEVLRLAAEAARRMGLPVDFELLGFSTDDNRLVDAGVHVHGRYDDGEIDARVAAVQADLVFLPSTWPETYCYTLSIALRSGLPVVVFDLGAQGRRVKDGAPAGSRTLPLALADQPENLLKELLATAGARTSDRSPLQAA
jgi:GT2 family glycosyltransferase/glycosyltransferase involved in cell wall biosynthesis